MKPNPFTTISHEVKMTAAEKAAMKSRLLTVMRESTSQVSPQKTTPTPSPITVVSFWKTTDFRIASSAAFVALCALIVVVTIKPTTNVTIPAPDSMDQIAMMKTVESDMVAPEVMNAVETQPAQFAVAQSYVASAPVETTRINTAAVQDIVPVAPTVPPTRVRTTAATTTTTTATSSTTTASTGGSTMAMTATATPPYDVSYYTKKVERLSTWNDLHVCNDLKKKELCNQVTDTLGEIEDLLEHVTYSNDPDLAQAKRLILEIEKNTNFILPADLAKLYL